MKRGGIIGLGGLLGLGLLSKGGAAGAGSMLGSLLHAAGKGSRGGSLSTLGIMKGGCGRSGKHGRYGGKVDDPLADAVQDALRKLSSKAQPPLANANVCDVLPCGEANNIDVECEDLPSVDMCRSKEALSLLSDCLVSYIPGRARIRHKLLRNEAFPDSLRNNLLGAGFLDVSHNASTGSVLLTWDARDMDRSAFFMAAMPLGESLLDHERRKASA